MDLTDINTNTECAICFDIYTETFKTHCCNQIIHKDCFIKSSDINGTCPFCRQSVINVIVNNPLAIIPEDTETNCSCNCCSRISNRGFFMCYYNSCYSICIYCSSYKLLYYKS
jgi:hypothetical protein